jgi:hypothetical protein
MESDDAPRKGKGRRTTVRNSLEETAVAGAIPHEVLIPRQRYERRLEKHSKADYAFVRRWTQARLGFVTDLSKPSGLYVSLLHGRRPYWRPEDYQGGNESDSADGVKRADQLERVKPSHVEDPLIAHLDFWKASGARRIPGRGYRPPRELLASVAKRLLDWTREELGKAFDWYALVTLSAFEDGIRSRLYEGYGPRKRCNPARS